MTPASFWPVLALFGVVAVLVLAVLSLPLSILGYPGKWVGLAAWPMVERSDQAFRMIPKFRVWVLFGIHSCLLPVGRRIRVWCSGCC
jgi:hypothetical protein